MKSIPPIRRHEQTGVALLEVLIALLIFSFAILGIVALQAKAIQFSSDSQSRTEAALLANDMVSIMWAQGTTSKTTLSSQITDWQSRISNSKYLPGGAAGSVSDPDATGAVTITVTWKAPYKANAEASNSYFTQIRMP